MKTNLAFLVSFLFLVNNSVAQINLKQFELLSLSSEAFRDKNYEEVIRINNQIIQSVNDNFSDESTYNGRNAAIFSIARAHFSKAKAKAYLDRLKEGYYDLDAAEGAYPKYPIFSFYKALYKTTFFDDDINEAIFLKKYGFFQNLINSSIVRELYNFGYYKEALLIYSSRLKKNKTSINYYNAGRILAITGNQKKATQYFKKGFELILNTEGSSDELYNYVLKIRFSQALKDKEKAIHLLNEAAIKYPEKVQLTRIRALNHYKNKEFEEAIGAYSQILLDDPYAGNAFIYLALSYIEMGEKEKGLAVLNELLTERPNYFYALCQRAKYYLDSNQFSSAKIDIEKALSLKPNHPLGFKLRGDLKLGLGQNKNACFDYKLAKEKYYLGVYPNNREFLNNINLACPK